MRIIDLSTGTLVYDLAGLWRDLVLDGIGLQCPITVAEKEDAIFAGVALATQIGGEHLNSRPDPIDASSIRGQ